LMCRLRLPLSKFIFFILNFIGCELVHLNLNNITTLSCFSMLCECWLDVPHDTSLFWYFYSLTCYEHMVFSGIGIMLHRNRRKEYLNVMFRGLLQCCLMKVVPRQLGGCAQMAEQASPSVVAVEYTEGS
jgi:hypothetical protein